MGRKQSKKERKETKIERQKDTAQEYQLKNGENGRSIHDEK